MRKKRIFQFFVLAAVLFFVPVLSAKAETTENTTEQDEKCYDFNMNVTRNYDYAKQIVDIVNRERAKAGVEPVEMDEEITEFAMQRAKETCFMFAHSRPNGISIYRSLFLVLGENILIDGSDSPEYAMEVWLNSAGHKANLLDSYWKSLGVGCICFNGNYFWVQEFCAREAIGSDLVKTGTYSAKESIAVQGKYLSLTSNSFSSKMYSGTKRKLNLGQPNVDLDYYRYMPEADSFDYTSSNNSVATISANGWIHALSEGDTTLTAYYAGTSDVAWSKDLQVISKVNKIQDDVRDEPICIADGGYYSLDDTYPYSGRAVKPNISMWYDTKKLKKGRDYTVSYKNNTRPGTASLYVQGIGNYTGRIHCTFRIVPKKCKVVFQNGKKRTAKYAKWNTSIKKVKKPKKKGYRFRGWYTSTGKKFRSSSKIRKNLVLYAKWAKKHK